MSTKKSHIRALNALIPKNNRRLLTFWRMIRYGTDSFLRNSWLSVAATAVMTITLLIILTSFLAQNILSDTITNLREKVDMSIYLQTDTTDDDGNALIAEVKKLETVKSASFISAAEARAKFAEENKDDPKVLQAINEATNKTPATLRVVVVDINNTTELEKFANENELVKEHINPDHEPSFAGERRDSIQKIGSWVNFAQQIGIVASVVFTVISSLIIFNTIRMAIFNRKEEIQMMKLIGADRSFIRGPFLVEAVIYGLIASFIATGLGMWILYGISKALMSYEINVQPTINMLFGSLSLVILIMMAIGAVVGTISSLLATRRYLKV